MKKTLALVGAGALGVAAGGVGVLPAHADATLPCVDSTEHQFSTDADPGNWYMDCIPQYGVGKAEFTIVPDSDDPTAEFPAGFTDLYDPATETSTTLDMTEINTYFTGGPNSPIQPVGPPLADTPTGQTYLAAVVAPVTGVAAQAPATAPASVRALCGVGADASYEGGWIATFGKVDTTFTQTVDGEDWSWKVEGTPLPSYFFGTIDESTGSLVTDADWCVTDGIGALTPANTGVGAPDSLFLFVYHSLPQFSEDTFVALATLGTFGGLLVVPVVPAAPQLAATGSDPLAPMITGGLLAMFGTALLAVTGIMRRRRRA